MGSCAGCGDPIALHRARPAIGADGRVRLWCAACAARPLVEHVAPAPPAPKPVAVAALSPAILAAPRRRATRYLPPLAGAAALAALVIAVPMVERDAPRSHARSIATDAPKTAAAAVTVPVPVPVPVSVAVPVAVAVAVPVAVAVAVPVPVSGTVAASAKRSPLDAEPAILDGADTATEELDLAALVAERPALLHWTHPVTGTDELTPVRSTRKFGAHRDGVSDPGRCGEGHCGVDLSGPRGRPIVAVAAGTVVRVEHSARGRDGRSGRYVRIEHPDGVFTSYMHLDAIAADLDTGDLVEPGQVLGTLGKTAIYHGEPHLHLGLEILDHGELRYLDPAPFLADAEVAPIPVDELRLAPDERAQW